jgi:hypothetical protein
MTPYKTGAPLYLDAGWAGVIPLPPRKKASPPSSYTGWQGRDPSDAMVKTWMEEKVGDYQRDSNIAIHMPDGWLSIDVDHYNGKTGGATLAELEKDLGKLPPTYKSTSKDDGVPASAGSESSQDCAGPLVQAKTSNSSTRVTATQSSGRASIQKVSSTGGTTTQATNHHHPAPTRWQNSHGNGKSSSQAVRFDASKTYRNATPPMTNAPLA